MGTSQSSTGPGAGVSLVPPWAEEAIPPTDGQSQDGSQPPAQQPNVPPPSDLSPPRRFVSTRRQLGNFAKSGDTGAMRAGVGHYITNGYGGSKTFARRMAGTGNTAWGLSRALNPSEPGSPLDRAQFVGKTANEIMDAVVEAVRPHDGTQDAESAREAVSEALTDLLTEFPDADLLDLTPEQREYALEKFVANDVFKRFELDVGKQVMDKAPNAALGLKRMQEIKEYMAEVVGAAFRARLASGAELSPGTVAQTVKAALEDSCRVFEEYTE